MIGNKDSVQLSEYCFNVCELLKTAIEGKNADDLAESERKALEDLERSVSPGLLCFHTEQIQDYMRNRADSQKGGGHATH